MCRGSGTISLSWYTWTTEMVRDADEEKQGMDLWHNISALQH